jgi:hypothetical protein
MRRMNEGIHPPPVRWRAPELHESWYSLWCSSCLRQPLAQPEVQMLLGGRGTTMMLDAGKWTTNRNTNLPDALLAAFDVSKETAVLLSGSDIDSNPRQSGHMHLGLRYCLYCLAHGYHSPVFQHLSIERCPLHGVPLRTKCVSCRASLNPTWLTAANNAFACANCNYLFVRSVPSKNRDSEVRRVGLMLASRREVIARRCQKSSHVRPCVLPASHPGGSLSTAMITRHVQRQSIWITNDINEWPTFKETVVRVHEERTEDANLFLGSVGVFIRRTLLRIRKLYGDEDPDLIKLQSVLGRLEGGRRINETASIVACAILKTEYLLGAQIHCGTAARPSPLGLLQAADPRCQSEQFGAVLWSFLEANSLLVEYEVLSLFCLILWRIGHMDRMVDVGWSEFPSTATFRPEWCFEDSIADPTLRIRSRADWKTVKFLIKRYRSRMLS